jgi:hypothetical protein
MRSGTDKGLTPISPSFTDKERIKLEPILIGGWFVALDPCQSVLSVYIVLSSSVLFGAGLVCRRLRLTDDA